MINRIIKMIIFMISVFIFIICLIQSSFNITFTKTEGKSPYFTKVTEKMMIFNVGKNVKSIEYCFTTGDKCNDYLPYSGDINKIVIKVEIDYPEYEEAQHICIRIKNKSSDEIYCNRKYYHVDNSSPTINQKYETIILNDKDEKIDYNELYEVYSSVGIDSMKCNVSKVSNRIGNIKCTAESKNGKKSTLTTPVYYNYEYDLEGKKIAFYGDELSYAKYDKYGGYAGRVGFSTYMDWYNYSKEDATIINGENSVLNQIRQTEDDKMDYIILEGGINDDEENLGSIIESKNVDDFNSNTFAGSIEELFYYTKKYNESSKIGFIIPHYINNEEQIDIIKKACNKWKISYLDLYSGSIYEGENSITYSKLLKDSKYLEDDNNLNSSGYDALSKYISIWIKTL